ncbi:hypothetical protein B5S33_g4695 [[Candida] boidinii]|nr:hypothetical protein B5S33_g4695 [[Candida] boidinii]
MSQDSSNTRKSALSISSLLSFSAQPDEASETKVNVQEPNILAASPSPSTSPAAKLQQQSNYYNPITNLMVHSSNDQNNQNNNAANINNNFIQTQPVQRSKAMSLSAMINAEEQASDSKIALQDLMSPAPESHPVQLQVIENKIVGVQATKAIATPIDPAAKPKKPRKPKVKKDPNDVTAKVKKPAKPKDKSAKAATKTTTKKIKVKKPTSKTSTPTPTPFSSSSSVIVGSLPPGLIEQTDLTPDVKQESKSTTPALSNILIQPKSSSPTPAIKKTTKKAKTEKTEKVVKPKSEKSKTNANANDKDAPPKKRKKVANSTDTPAPKKKKIKSESGTVSTVSNDIKKNVTSSPKKVKNSDTKNSATSSSPLPSATSSAPLNTATTKFVPQVSKPLVLLPNPNFVENNDTISDDNEQENKIERPKIIALHIPLVQEGKKPGEFQAIFNVMKLCEDKYGWNVMHPNGKIAFDLNDLDELDELDEDDEIDEDEDNELASNSAPPVGNTIGTSVLSPESPSAASNTPTPAAPIPSANISDIDMIQQHMLSNNSSASNKHDKKKISDIISKFKPGMSDEEKEEIILKEIHRRKMDNNRRVGKYDLNDPFIDDEELLFEEQRSSTRDGFFVYYGSLVEENQNGRLENSRSLNVGVQNTLHSKKKNEVTGGKKAIPQTSKGNSNKVINSGSGKASSNAPLAKIALKPSPIPRSGTSSPGERKAKPVKLVAKTKKKAEEVPKTEKPEKTENSESTEKTEKPEGQAKPEEKAKPEETAETAETTEAQNAEDEHKHRIIVNPIIPAE